MTKAVRCEQPTCCYPSCRCQVPFVAGDGLPVHLQFRPLLVSGMTGRSADAVHILIDTEQTNFEQVRSIWHETLHLLGIADEEAVEGMARKLAAACPEVLPILKDIKR